MYTIKKGRFYVRDTAKFGGKSSYTTNIKYAVRFKTYDEAIKDACGNERVVKLELQYA